MRPTPQQRCGSRLLADAPSSSWLAAAALLATWLLPLVGLLAGWVGENGVGVLWAVATAAVVAGVFSDSWTRSVARLLRCRVPGPTSPPPRDRRSLAVFRRPPPRTGGVLGAARIAFPRAPGRAVAGT